MVENRGYLVLPLARFDAVVGDIEAAVATAEYFKLDRLRRPAVKVT